MLPLGEFNKEKRNLDGLTSYCKICRRKDNAAYCVKNKEKIKIAKAAHHAKNKEKLNKISREYYKIHKERL